VDNSTNAWQSITDTNHTKIVSPEAPDSYWEYAASNWMFELATIRSNVPISYILNGGEYGMGVAGFGIKAWAKDPRVQAATNAYPPELTLSSYASARKAHQVGFLTAAIDKAVPDRELSIFYNTGNEQNRYTYFSNWFANVDLWGWNSDVMVTNTDLPSFPEYYEAWERWTSLTNPLPNDMLTSHLDAVGYNIKLGESLNYSWVCAGWPQGNGTNDFSDTPHYLGYLKCLYTGGMVGAVAAYFTYPTNGFDATFATNNPPQWLIQMIALSRVHALFSHLDNFLYSGTLLSGPQSNSMAKDQPAHEFTNNAADATARVLARKLTGSNEWLITAWAASGSDRNVTVTIPVLGPVTVLARDSGAVYVATTNSLVLQDVNGLLPTETPSPPTDLHIVTPGP
jgi:hypothetical protein